MTEPNERNDALERPEAVAPDGGTGEAGTPAAGPVVMRQRRSIWDDSRVRAMGIAAVVIVILYLLTIVSALVFGFIGGQKAPQTLQEREVMVSESKLRSREASTTTADQWQSYVTALVDAGQFRKAESVIEEVNGKPVIDQSIGAHMTYAEALLNKAEGKDEEALKLFEETMKLTKEAYDKELARGAGDGKPNWAMATGLHSNYSLSAAAMAAIYRDQEKWAEGVEMLDLYVAENPQEAGILVDRAYLKVQLGDTKGAEADYRQALRFVPDFEEALDGLRSIGVDE